MAKKEYGFHAIVLAGGLGTRLREVIGQTPKPLASIADRPFLAYLLEFMANQRVSTVILSIGYMQQTVINTLGDKFDSLSLQYSVEEMPLGTGGAIKKAMERVPSSYVFIVNGDTLFKVNYVDMMALALKRRPALVMALKRVDDCSRYGRVVLEGDRVIGFDEKGVPGAGVINGGLYLMVRSIFDGWELLDKFSFEKDFLNPHIRALAPIAYVSDSYFIDIGVPQDYERARRELPREVGL